MTNIERGGSESIVYIGGKDGEDGISTGPGDGGIDLVDGVPSKDGEVPEKERDTERGPAPRGQEGEGGDNGEGPTWGGAGPGKGRGPDDVHIPASGEGRTDTPDGPDALRAAGNYHKEKTKDSLLSSLWSGASAQVNMRALDVAIKMAA